MDLKQFTQGGEGIVRRYDYPDSSVVVADLGLADESVTVDTVDETGIVVVERGGDSEQFEFDLPAGDVAKAFINNGVVTVEVDK